jgi:hypothetical protein
MERPGNRVNLVRLVSMIDYIYGKTQSLVAITDCEGEI